MFLLKPAKSCNTGMIQLSNFATYRLELTASVQPVSFSKKDEPINICVDLLAQSVVYILDTLDFNIISSVC